MQSHSDCDAPFNMEGLKRKATNMVRDRMSEITVGLPGEQALNEYVAHGVTVTRRPDDEHGIHRISVGGAVVGKGQEFDYCVFRGSPEVCAALLDEAAKAIRAGQ